MDIGILFYGNLYAERGIVDMYSILLVEDDVDIMEVIAEAC